MLSVAALEATINEIYLAAVDHSESLFDKDRPEKIQLLAELWNEIECKFSILEKHQTALVAFGVSPFHRGSEPFQSAEDLIRLRNSLVHFKPEWDYKLDTHAKLEKRLRSRFAESGLWC